MMRAACNVCEQSPHGRWQDSGDTYVLQRLVDGGVHLRQCEPSESATYSFIIQSTTYPRKCLHLIVLRSCEQGIDSIR